MILRDYVMFVIILLLFLACGLMLKCSSISKDFGDYGIGAKLETPIGDFEYNKESKKCEEEDSKENLKEIMEKRNLKEVED